MLRVMLMSTIESPVVPLSQPQPTNPIHSQNNPLRVHVELALQNYFSHLDGQPTTNLYELVLAEVLEPLLKTTLRQTRGNQSKAAIILGISRGTLRKMLKKYSLE